MFGFKQCYSTLFLVNYNKKLPKIVLKSSIWESIFFSIFDVFKPNLTQVTFAEPIGTNTDVKLIIKKISFDIRTPVSWPLKRISPHFYLAIYNKRLPKIFLESYVQEFVTKAWWYKTSYDSILYVLSNLCWELLPYPPNTPDLNFHLIP